MDKEKQKVHTKPMLVRDIAERCFINGAIEKMGVQRAVATAAGVYNALEARVKELLHCATPDEEVAIRLFEGITLKGVYAPEVVKRNNLTGKMMTYKAHIEPKVVFTKHFRDGLIVQE